MAEMWAEGDAYEYFMGRWSRLVAPRFLAWLDLPPGLRWADIGCGTGALTLTLLALADPAFVLALEPSPGFLATARAQVKDRRVDFHEGSTELLEGERVDVVAAGLVVNFLPDPRAALRAFVRAAPGGTVAAYVWDYDDGMQLLRRFWEVATDVAGHPVAQSEISRFDLTDPARLEELWRDAGLQDVQVAGLEVETVFDDFEDYWSPFLGGQGPAPAYVMSLDETHRGRLREALEENLAPDDDGTIRLVARAWAVRGRVPGGPAGRA